MGVFFSKIPASVPILMQMSEESKFSITQVVLSLGAGGTERLVLDLCKGLQPIANVQVLCLDELGVWAKELVDAGIEVSCLGRKPGFDTSLVRRVREKLRAHGSQIVHCHHYTPYIYGCLGSLSGPRARVIYTEHGRLTQDPWTVKRRIANAIFGRLPAKFFAVSENLREHMVDGGIPDSRVKVIYNGVVPGHAPTEAVRATARHELGLEPNAFVLGTVARLDPVKDLVTLLQAFAIVRESLPNGELVVVGDGSERGPLESLSHELGIAQHVHFLGHRDDARALLAGCDTYVNCSITEGVSVTILEAMAAQLPVVVTDVGGTPEVVEHDVTGLMVPARDPPALANALLRISADRALHARLASAARAHVIEHFATATMLANYLKIYGHTP
ncbi:MAG: glycosyltransferase involved in cell wall biosynthesis [Gammaproteobacteria bacterium]|jgi:glycosyltransferase involved in cell wall biosynthesis